MIDLGIGLSWEKNPALAAKEAIKNAKAKMHDDRIDLVFAIASMDLSYITLLKSIAGYLPGVSIIGSGSAAFISGQGVSRQGLLLATLGLPKDAFSRIAYSKDIKAKTGISAGEEMGGRLLHGLPDMQRTLSLLLTNADMEDGQNLIYGLQGRLGRSFPLIGAFIGENPGQLKNYLYLNQEMSNDASSSVLLGGKLNFGVGIRHGWQSLGKPHRITACRNNIVQTIDDKPAAGLYEEYLGGDFNKIKKDLKLISLLYPLGIDIKGEEECLLRTVLAIEDNGNLRLSNSVAEGNIVRLMICTRETCLNAAKLAAEEAQKSLLGHISEQAIEHKKEGTSKFILVFNSSARLRILKNDTSQEIAIIKNVLGQDSPIIGLYTYAELAPLKAVSYRGEVYCRNHTITILIIEG